jgi:hypothetical protein
MDPTQATMPIRFVSREILIHVCFHYHFQSFMVDT